MSNKPIALVGNKLTDSILFRKLELAKLISEELVTLEAAIIFEVFEVEFSTLGASSIGVNVFLFVSVGSCIDGGVYIYSVLFIVAI